MKPQPAGPLLTEFLRGVDRTPMNTVNFITALNARVQREIGYIVRLETGVLEPEETLARAQGSCRDSSWLLVQALRQLGFAARFASGYLIQLMPDEKLAGRPRRADTRLHRSPRLVRGLPAGCRLDWPRPDLGPVDGRRPYSARLHPRLPSSAAPIEGHIEKAEVQFEHEMSVARVARDTAHHEALHRRAVGKPARSRRGDRARHRPA
jgi:hypothetical protein